MTTLAPWLIERTPAAIVGVGNRLRADDGAGSRVAERLRERGCGTVFDAETVPENYLGVLLATLPGRVLFVDAARWNGRPGECRLDPIGALAPRRESTHAPSLALLAGILERHGGDCWLLGIQPATTAHGAAMSPDVERSVDNVVHALAAALAREVSRD